MTVIRRLKGCRLFRVQLIDLHWVVQFEGQFTLGL